MKKRPILISDVLIGEIERKIKSLELREINIGPYSDIALLKEECVICRKGEIICIFDGLSGERASNFVHICSNPSCRHYIFMGSDAPQTRKGKHIFNNSVCAFCRRKVKIDSS